MIRLVSIEITNFRGIKSLTLDLDSANFAISGRNGSGKSGVVDAIEFALAGKISRLSGAGTGGVSVGMHGPHVDFRDNPGNSRVSVVFTIPASGSEQFTVTRSPAHSASPSLTPDNQAARSALGWLGAHPEFALSRRELVKFIIGEASKRSEEVEALLRLEKVGEARSLLQKIKNADSKTSSLAKGTLVQSSTSLQQLVPGVDLDNGLLEELNALRVECGLEALDAYPEVLAVSDDDLTASPPPHAASKSQWTQDLGRVEDTLASFEMTTSVAETISMAVSLNSDHSAMHALRSDSFYVEALELFDGEHCPACGLDWDSAAFWTELNAKRQASALASESLQAVAKRAAKAVSELSELAASVTSVAGWAPKLMPDGNQAATAMNQEFRSLAVALTSVQTAADIERLATCTPINIAAVSELVVDLRPLVDAIPEMSAQFVARAKLVTFVERANARAAAVGTSKRLEIQAARSLEAFELFESNRAHVLEAIYTNVQSEFARLYAIVNSDDEGSFSAELTSTGSGLDLKVDFYGRGNFPPIAFHSEGHQDGMGLCLYLALMKHTLGVDFTFAVLDDVVMSIDAGHRRELLTMLGQEFSNTQFIITTHDDLWVETMRHQGFVSKKQMVKFREWDIENGPSNWVDHDSIGEARAKALAGDVRGAAATLRRLLEYTFRELCHDFQTPVRFRLDGHSTLGELILPAVSSVRKWIKVAKVSAQSWGFDDRMIELAALEASITSATAATRSEDWAINTAIHFNAWENFSPEEFLPVLDAFEALFSSLSCANCGFLRISDSESGPDSLRCECGTVNHNLVPRPASA